MTNTKMQLIVGQTGQTWPGEGSTWIDAVSQVKDYCTLVTVWPFRIYVGDCWVV